MEIKIRDMDSNVVDAFDRLAKKRNISRNEYLKLLLTNIANNDLMKDEREDYNRTLSRVADSLEITHERLESMEKNFEKLYLLKVQELGLTLKEAHLMLSNMITYEED